MYFSHLGSASASKMVIQRRSSREKDKKSRENGKKSEPLIPGLPDEISELCLLHLPYPYQASARLVSSSWNRAITDPSFVLSKKSLSVPYLFVFAFHKSTAKIQWQALDPRSGRWFVLPRMPGPKSVFPTAFAFASNPRQGELFVLGGMESDTETPMQTTIVYRTSTSQWSTAARMPTARSFFTAGNVNGKIVAMGGSGISLNDSITTVDCYDPETDRWATVRSMPVGLSRYSSAAVGNRMYVTEGWTWPFMISPRGGIYDPGSDTWEVMRDGMRSGWTGVSVVLGDRLVVMSEHAGCPMKMYDADNDTWRYVGGDKFPCGVLQRPFAMGEIEGKIYVVGSGLNVGIGELFEGEKGNLRVKWKVLDAPKAFQNFSPANCQVLYA